MNEVCSFRSGCEAVCLMSRDKVKANKEPRSGKRAGDVITIKLTRFAELTRFGEQAIP